MWHNFVLYFVSAFILQCVVGCETNVTGICEQRTSSCTTQILDDKSDAESCKVEYFEKNSEKCKSMQFDTSSTDENLGGVSLQPYILQRRLRKGSLSCINHTVLNISFSNIKWKTMRFRFKHLNKNENENHCRNIVISKDAVVRDNSVLYYDCYWQTTAGNNGQSHVLEFEASDGQNTNTGSFIFDVPTPYMLSKDTTEEYWRPFVYIEVLGEKFILHIMPPPMHLNILEYKIEVMRESNVKPDELITDATIDAKNMTNEVTQEFNVIQSTGKYYFLVTTVHERCKKGEIVCQVVRTPIAYKYSLEICQTTKVGLAVGILFVLFLLLLAARRRYCKEYGSLKEEQNKKRPIIVVVYSAQNDLHAKCVHSFVHYLRKVYGFNVKFDNDIAFTSHKDPVVWVDEAFDSATHLIYMVGPKNDNDVYKNDALILPSTPYRYTDNCLLQRLQEDKARNPRNHKIVLNVFFDHSNAELPIETKHDRKFYLLNDWHKLIAFLSEGELAKTQLERSEDGRNLMNNLTQAKKLLNNDMEKKEVIFKCDKTVTHEKKGLL